MLTRRRVLSRFLIGASAVAAIGSADALFLEPRNLVSEHIDIRLRRLPEEFRGFRIAQISDVHFGPYMGKSGLERALQLAQSFQPDLLALTGDFVSHPFGGSHGPRGAHYAEPCADVLAAVKGVPVLAILGNHDHWNNAAIVEGALKDRGIQVLRNRSPVDLQLSGHSHGGQVRLPGIGALVLPALAEKYPIGLNQVGSLQVYTNRGLGVINPPVRLYCPPEVTFVTLFPAQPV